MPSVIPDLEYDIFISYRQKDNKGEKWVSEFVDTLSTELDATFKEDVSVYFDINPHHGLLEVHDVDDSLRDKLKCAVFIPVISQTYCDPNSFAWRCEFLAFKKFASSDPYGIKVKVANGNVISRILPVRIHELDAADRQLIENEIGPLRSVDFIFKSAGVNRPLRQKDDELATTRQVLYRDQVNKLANAIKEIITGLKNFGQREEIHKPGQLDINLLKDIRSLPKTKTLAILPFVNETNDASLDYLPEAISDLLFPLFSISKDLKLPSKAFYQRLKQNEADASTLAKKMGVHLLVRGKLVRQDKRLQLQVSVADPSGGTIQWNTQFDLQSQQLLTLGSAIAVSVMNALGVELKEQEKQFINHVPLCSEKAFYIFLKGKYYFKKGGDHLLESLELFREVVKAEPKFAQAHAALAINLLLLAYLKKLPYEDTLLKAKTAALSALEVDRSLLEGYHALAFICMNYEWNWQEAESVFKKVYAINPFHPRASTQFGLCLEKIKSILKEAEHESVITAPVFIRAYAQLHLGLFEEELTAALEAVEREPDSFMAHRALGLSYLGLEKYDQAVKS